MIRIEKQLKYLALSSDGLKKYEYLTGEDLGYKPHVIQKAKFEYSPLGKVFNKGLDENDKKEGVLKKLENIEGINKKELGEQSKLIKSDINSTERKPYLKFLAEVSQDAKKVQRN